MVSFRPADFSSASGLFATKALPWPSSAESDEEYTKLLDGYGGECLENERGYVAGILDDPTLNKECCRVSFTGSSGASISLIDQMRKDLRRCRSIEINGETIYASRQMDHVETIIYQWSGEDQFKVTFDHCVTALHGDLHLANNVFKLSTQASLCKQALCIMERFYKVNGTEMIPVQEASWGHWIAVESLLPSVVSIAIHMLWKIDSPSGGVQEVKYIKGITKFAADVDRLRRGDGKGAFCCEIISRPFDKLREEAVHCGEWPKNSKSAAQYDARLKLFPEYRERLLDCELESVRGDCKSDEKIATLKAIERALSSRELPLNALSIDGKRIYQRGGYIDHLSTPFKRIFDRAVEHFPGNKLYLSKFFLLLAITLPFHLRKRVYERFIDARVGRLISSSGYEAAIDRCGEEGISILLTSRWHSRDATRGEGRPPKIDTFQAGLQAKLLYGRVEEVFFAVIGPRHK